jgi:hypothetical protein
MGYNANPYPELLVKSLITTFSRGGELGSGETGRRYTSPSVG